MSFTFMAAAAAAAKSLQSCQTLCDPIDGSPPGSPVPGILHARTLEWVAISFSSGYGYIGALFVPSIGTTDIMIKVEALTNFTKQALLDRTKAIPALNEE